MDARAIAARAIAAVSTGRSLDSSLAPLARLTESRDRAHARELCYGVLRWQPQLSSLLEGLLERPLRGKDGDVQALLLIGLYQILHLDTPAHAVVSATAGAGRGLRKAWSVGLINAVLRRAIREQDALREACRQSETCHYAHPGWLLRRLRRDWPDDWQAIAAANNRRAPMTLRVNARQHQREDYLQRLAASGIAAAPAPHTRHGITLARALDVDRLPGFATGAVSVQDAAAQAVAPLLDLRPGLEVLDACAAPGGKSAHILESEPELRRLLALDPDAGRMQRLEETLKRLGLDAETRLGDATRPGEWAAGEDFDRILIDAPCSGTGVIRRHPDIKLLRRSGDIATLAARQRRLVLALWPLLRAGGRMVYASCSVLAEENDRMIAGLLTCLPGASLPPLAPEYGHERDYGRQVLPGESDRDGFYYCAIDKRG